jgi:S-adenosylmethionine hydrolase
VIDPGVGGTRAPVIVDNGDQLFVGPDNGVFSLVAPTPRTVHTISMLGFRREKASATFQGRDIFAVAAGRLAAGARPKEAGPRCELEGCLTLPRSAAKSDTLYATVVHVDAFGNLITDLDPDELPTDPRFLVAGRVIEKLSETFGNVEKGELLVYVGSGNTLEVAQREGSAAANLEVERGAIIKVLSGDDKS